MMRPWIVRPAMLYRTYRIDICPVCGCAGWHVWMDDGSCKHANGVTYGAGALVARMGTSGTFVGTSRRLKVLNPAIKTIAMQPDSPLHGLEGMKHMATTILPGIYDKSIADSQIDISTEEAMETSLRLAREEGIFVGISSGANVCAALKLAASLPADSIVVTILCDNGFRYLSEELWLRVK